MSNSELLEIYLKLARGTRSMEDDAAMLVRLAEVAREEGVEEASVGQGSNVLNDCLYAIAHSDALFPPAIASWLSSDVDVGLGKALVHQASVARLNQSHPQAYDLTVVEELQAVVVARRLCALAAAPAVSLGWVLSMARQFPQGVAAARALIEVLDFHATELPGSTQKLLASPESAFQDLEASIATLASLESEDAELNALPHLREFEMSADMRLIFASLKRSEQREIHRRADEYSIFRLITRQIKLKYGGNPVVEVKGDAGAAETTIEMSSHELSIELPLSEATDPLLGRLKRNRLWKGEH